MTLNKNKLIKNIGNHKTLEIIISVYNNVMRKIEELHFNTLPLSGSVHLIYFSKYLVQLGGA